MRHVAEPSERVGRSGEFEVIRRYFARSTPQALLGPGDDCALLRPSLEMELAVSTDMLVEGTHFLANADPNLLGWKSLAVNLSDLAAMGAEPRWALLALALPDDCPAWLAAFSDGFFACARRYGVDLVGGDTTRGPRNVCLTVLGEIPAGTALRRDQALPGDEIWVSGQPGLAALGLAHLQRRVHLPEDVAGRCLSALNRPQPRVELGRELRKRGLTRAAIDISDGLLADLKHILERSAVGAEVFLSRLPPMPAMVDPALARQCQLAGGDDYELLFCASPERRSELCELAEQIDVPLWPCGRLVESVTASVRVFDANNNKIAITQTGYDHFA